jgi:FkbM family methyltransferase
MLAATRPESWNLPLFVHVAGAMILVAGLLTGAGALTLARGDTRLLRLGYFSLLASALVGPTGQVHAFEPLADNLSLLWQHVRLNRLSNVAVHPTAVSDSHGRSRFALGGNRSTGKLDCQGDLEVDVVTLDEFVFGAHNPPPNLIKIDVEGGEGRVLRGAQRLLRTHHPVIFLATHGKEVHQECCELLVSERYHLQGLTGEPADRTDELLCLYCAG